MPATRTLPLLSTVVAIAALCVTAHAQTPATMAAAPFGSTSPKLAPCRLPGVEREARCGRFDVAENPQRPSGRHLSVYVAVLPALRSPVAQDPIAFLSGGPGESAVASAGDIGAELAALSEDRDILLVDQRGTGNSGALPCELYLPERPEASLTDVFPIAAVQRCVETLRRHADLTQYGYARFADDLEHVRRTLGYGRLNLIGLSYGTRAAQVYLRAYPDSVRTIYLGSAVPIDIATPLPFARSAQDALDMTIAACERDAACSAAFPALREETRQIFARLAAGSVRVDVPGTKRKTTLVASRIAERLRAMMYKPEGAAMVPWTIHRAHLGDWTPFAAGILEGARETGADIDFGLFFSITCNEDVAFIRQADIAPAVQGTYLGDYRVRQQQAACARWPKFSLPDGYRDPIKSAVPTLIVSGDADPATPLSFTEHLAPGFSERAEIILHGQAHTGWSPCVARAYQHLLREGSVKGIDTACEATPLPPFKTDA